MLTSYSIEVTWDQSSSPSVTDYLVSYTTTASYTSSGNVTVNGSSNSATLTDLEENTLYIITVQAAVGDSNHNTIVNANSNEVSVTTYTASK